jgi:hypothetical protein
MMIFSMTNHLSTISTLWFCMAEVGRREQIQLCLKWRSPGHAISVRLVCVLTTERPRAPAVIDRNLPISD